MRWPASFRFSIASSRIASTAGIFYGNSRANIGQIEKWSSKFDWLERIAAYDEWIEMHHRDGKREPEKKRRRVVYAVRKSYLTMP
jgi:hypothetical protein